MECEEFRRIWELHDSEEEVDRAEPHLEVCDVCADWAENKDGEFLASFLIGQVDLSVACPEVFGPQTISSMLSVPQSASVVRMDCKQFRESVECGREVGLDQVEHFRGCEECMGWYEDKYKHYVREWGQGDKSVKEIMRDIFDGPPKH